MVAIPKKGLCFYIFCLAEYLNLFTSNKVQPTEKPINEQAPKTLSKIFFVLTMNKTCFNQDWQTALNKRMETNK